MWTSKYGRQQLHDDIRKHFINIKRHLRAFRKPRSVIGLRAPGRKNKPMRKIVLLLVFARATRWLGTQNKTAQADEWVKAFVE